MTETKKKTFKSWQKKEMARESFKSLKGQMLSLLAQAYLRGKIDALEGTQIKLPK